MRIRLGSPSRVAVANVKSVASRRFWELFYSLPPERTETGGKELRAMASRQASSFPSIQNAERDRGPVHGSGRGSLPTLGGVTADTIASGVDRQITIARWGEDR